MYEFIHFLQLSCMNSYIFCRSCERAARATRAKPELTSCPNQVAPDLCRSDHSHLFKSRYIESDQNIQIQFYMQHRSNFIWLSHHVISDSVFLNGQQIHSERKTKKNWTETKTYRSDSTWFLHHLDPILRNDFSCRSKSTEKPILAVTEYCNVSSKKLFVANARLVINRAGKTHFICRNLYKTYETVGFVPGSNFFLTFCTTQDENQSPTNGIDRAYHHRSHWIAK